MRRATQIENWPTAHLDETRRNMMEAVKAWRSAAVAHGHAVDMYDIAEETDRKGEKADTRGLRPLAQDLRERTAQLVPIDTRYDTTAVQASAYACNEALDRINEKHALVAARLNDTAAKLDDIAQHYDTPPGKRPRTAHQRPR